MQTCCDRWSDNDWEWHLVEHAKNGGWCWRIRKWKPRGSASGYNEGSCCNKTLLNLKDLAPKNNSNEIVDAMVKNTWNVTNITLYHLVKLTVYPFSTIIYQHFRVWSLNPVFLCLWTTAICKKAYDTQKLVSPNHKLEI